MAEFITKRAFFEINFSDGRSPSFMILSSCNALLVFNLVTQGSGSVENVIKMGYATGTASAYFLRRNSWI